MRPDSPGPALVGSACLVPTWLPTANASSTSASQPKVAVFQCAALQRPTRAATLGRRCAGRDCCAPDAGLSCTRTVFMAAPLPRDLDVHELPRGAALRLWTEQVSDSVSSRCLHVRMATPCLQIA